MRYSQLKKRLDYLDSIKGIMSLNVVLNHFIIVFYPAMFFIDKNSSNSILENYAKSPFSVLTNGNIAVMFFFSLSGFLTALIIFKSKDDFNLKKLIKRGFKKIKNILFLVVPSIFFAYLLMKFDLMFHLKSIGLGINSKFILDYNNFVPTISSVIYDSFIGVFLKKSLYVGPLWSMKWEFWGTMITMLLILIVRKNKFRRVFYVLSAILLITISANLPPFIFGVFIADLYVYDESNATYFSRYYYKIINSNLFLYILMIVGIYFSSVPVSFVGIYSWMSIIPFIHPVLIRSIGIAMIIFFVLKNSLVQKILSTPKLIWLGGISSYIYILHWPIMLSFEHYFFQVMINANFTFNVSAITSILITIPIIIFSSYLFKLIFENLNLSITNLKTKITRK